MSLLVALTGEDPPMDPPMVQDQLREWEERNVLVVSRQPFLNVFVVDPDDWEAAKRERKQARRARRENRRARAQACRERRRGA